MQFQRFTIIVAICLSSASFAYNHELAGYPPPGSTSESYRQRFADISSDEVTRNCSSEMLGLGPRMRVIAENAKLFAMERPPSFIILLHYTLIKLKRDCIIDLIYDRDPSFYQSLPMYQERATEVINAISQVNFDQIKVVNSYPTAGLCKVIDDLCLEYADHQFNAHAAASLLVSYDKLSQSDTFYASTLNTYFTSNELELKKQHDVIMNISRALESHKPKIPAIKEKYSEHVPQRTKPRESDHILLESN